MARKTQAIQAARKDRERAHYTREFARLNTPHTDEAIDALLRPMEKALYDIEHTGEGLVDREGDYLFDPQGNEEYFPLDDAIFALCKTLSLAMPDDRAAGLMRLGHKLQAHMPLFPSDVDAAWIGFGWAREAMKKLTPTEFLRLTDQAEG